MEVEDLETESKEDVNEEPETKNSQQSKKSSESDDNEPEETLSERLWGLTEMFPEPIRNISYTAAIQTKLGICKAFMASRSAIWIIFSSSIVLFAPVLLEVERANMEEMQKSQQKEVLLGPSGTISGGVSPMLVPSMS